VCKCNLLILACCLAPSSVLAQPQAGPGYAEAIPTPAPEASSPAPIPCNTASYDAADGGGAAYPPRPTPWYYWWLAYHGRGQHYAYLPPLPGPYYFRPYSVTQLRMQQKAAIDWGADPRNPYSNRMFQSIYPRKEPRAIISDQ
jgi:hypothetical protein